ncbi:response regulator transcription factor [Deinococcus roseus]|uniref:Mycobacterial persistence regulator MrpA (Two component response transcriptional regulatory protein) n=1 Tax=Deinococcus roseus TaxID=392414 RepID=A0ABQ2D5R7_9DEIO|nr:response regulator transcription factor [Deinococcus roseus]GGJ44712.1 Mycobacterial persistence regulator MrpA (two component response transcriptional regulatory protein) [Deinococcus roseus]
MQTVLVVDDDPRMLAMVRRGLAFEGYRVLEAPCGQDALQVLRNGEVDLVVLDVMLPDLSGLEVLRKFRAAGEDTPVVLLTARDKPHQQVEGLEVGADDYITKPFSFEVLLARIRLILRKRSPDRSELRFSDVLIDLQRHQVRRGDRNLHLTPLEFKLLQTLMENPERVFSKPMLLDRVWGMEYFGDANVVEVVVSGLRQKLEEGGDSRLIHTIRGAGYILRED